VALSKVANHPILTYCAGRTDSGVHATGQVVHFDTTVERANQAWVRGVNTYLPKDIRVLGCYEVDNAFDARKSATFRRYCYVIANQSVSPGIMHQSMTWVIPRLDENAMQEGVSHLVGKHDFTSFRATQCQAKTPIRTIHSAYVQRVGHLVILDITANAFLHHMVRNIVGTLLEVAKHKQSPQWIKSVLDAKDRRFAGLTAPPEGLYLVQVGYPNYNQVPTDPLFPWFFGPPLNIPLI
jgi:tRNA pseudouridine38-40 synthase